MKGFPVSAAVIGMLLAYALKQTYDAQEWWMFYSLVFAAGHQIYVAWRVEKAAA